MPMPPMPVKCRCWGRKNISLSYCFGFRRRMSIGILSAASSKLVGRAPRRAGSRELPRRFAPCAPARPADPASSDTTANKCSPVHLRIAHQARRAAALHGLGIARLVIVGGERETAPARTACPAAASSETAPAPERQTTRSAAANAAGISAMKGTTSPSRPDCAKPSRRSLEARGAGLMHDAHRKSGLAEQRPTLARRPVQRARPLAAAGDQDLPAPPPRGFGGIRKNSSRTGSPVISVRPVGKIAPPFPETKSGRGTRSGR